MRPVKGVLGFLQMPTQPVKLPAGEKVFPVEGFSGNLNLSFDAIVKFRRNLDSPEVWEKLTKPTKMKADQIPIGTCGLRKKKKELTSFC